MTYRKVLAWIVIESDDEDVAVQHINDALDGLDGKVTVFESGVDIKDTAEPENADEIKAPA